ncbi:MAG: KH domain-containing protein [Actinobacteria bacterium]|nr:KH domain-containing protein [Actinomycetota bacterium]
MSDADAQPLDAPTARAVLEYLARSIVDDPDAVRVEVEAGGRGDLTLNLHVAEGELGRVIGKRGRVAQSIRTIVRAAAVRDDVTVGIEFVD